MIVAKTLLLRKRREPCLGDLRQRVKLHDRDIQEPKFGDPDFTEEFSGTKVVWASVKTIMGQTIFTGANVDVALSHEIIIRFDERVNSETWIEFEGNNLNIVNVEDLDERHDFMRLRCMKRGDKDLGAAQG
jgi:SPP1 family predicted phage head-tail adaptor